MLILAIHTATSSLSAALWQDGSLVAEHLLSAGRPHAETLLPLIEDLLRQAGRPIASIDAYACSIGPGSYTGIRIGVSAIKALAYAGGKPAVGVSTLEAMAWPFSACPGTLACPLLDARNGRVYAAAWQDGECRVEEANWLIGDYVEQLARISADSLIIGDLPPVVRNRLEAECSGQPARVRIRFAPSVLGGSIAPSLAEIAAGRLLAGFAGSAEALSPCYLSPSQAERMAAQNRLAGHA